MHWLCVKCDGSRISPLGDEYEYDACYLQIYHCPPVYLKIYAPSKKQLGCGMDIQWSYATCIPRVFWIRNDAMDLSVSVIAHKLFQGRIIFDLNGDVYDLQQISGDHHRIQSQNHCRIDPNLRKRKCTSNICIDRKRMRYSKHKKNDDYNNNNRQMSALLTAAAEHIANNPMLSTQENLPLICSEIMQTSVPMQPSVGSTLELLPKYDSIAANFPSIALPPLPVDWVQFPIHTSPSIPLRNIGSHDECQKIIHQQCSQISRLKLDKMKLEHDQKIIMKKMFCMRKELEKLRNSSSSSSDDDIKSLSIVPKQEIDNMNDNEFLLRIQQLLNNQNIDQIENVENNNGNISNLKIETVDIPIINDLISGMFTNDTSAVTAQSLPVLPALNTMIDDILPVMSTIEPLTLNLNENCNFVDLFQQFLMQNSKEKTVVENPKQEKMCNGHS